ncbi:putative sucrose transporter [Calycina marina]|uniref:Sucrose transporter n=1 Tax=Calycina marina TaxID=1763456 RepID=A0A9P7YX24_9HELO|nr:putative sucrose transporter [Calycina marina]
MEHFEIDKQPGWVRGSRYALYEPLATSWRLFTLTSSIGGLQLVWSTILSSGTLFLLSLGFSKSSTALIWSLAPICGTVVQPYFGMISDQSQNVMGRRKPFMLGGAIGVSVSLMGLALSESMAVGLLKFLELDTLSRAAHTMVQGVAVTWFCFLNIAIQPLQVAGRAFIIENASAEEQILAHAWASRIQGVGSILGLFLGSVSLPPILPYGNTMTGFLTLCLLISICLLVTVTMSCVLVEEKCTRGQTSAPYRGTSLFSRIRDTLVSIKMMPRTIRKVCLVQSFAWMGWFPFLMYHTTYISEIHETSDAAHVATAGSRKSNPINMDAVHFGSLAGLLLAVLALATNCLVPVLVRAFETAGGDKIKQLLEGSKASELTANSNTIIAFTWVLGHAYFVTAMILTFFITSRFASMLLVASVGISWAITLWVPYCLVGAVLARRQRLELDDALEAGVVMGFHNVAISAPQIISAVICSIVFTLCDGTDSGVAWVLRIGGFWTLVAAYLSWGMVKEMDSL